MQKFINFYGRVSGHLGYKAKLLIDEVLPKYSLSKYDFFENNFTNLIQGYEKVNLEIGFGSGDFILESALRNKTQLYIGVEIFLSGIASLCKRISLSESLGSPDNLKIYRGNIHEILAILPKGVFDNIYLLFPDPWHKKRHNKRRMVNDTNVAIFADLLKQGGGFRFVSDDYDYVGVALSCILFSDNFHWIAKDVKDFSLPPYDHISTKYEKKAVEKGRAITYLDFIKKFK